MRIAVNKRIIDLTINDIGAKLELIFPYSKSLIAEVKAMEGVHYCGYDKPPRKIWTVANSPRNWFQINYWAWCAMSKEEREAVPDMNPYYRYRLTLDSKFESSRKLYAHQLESLRFILTRRRCILAEEMGLGKTLSAIEAMEIVKQNLILRGDRVVDDDVFLYVGPKSGIVAVSRELIKWQSKVNPRMVTYEGLVREIEHWPSGKKPPLFIVFDESSKIKTPTAQRSKAARYLADANIMEWEDEGYVVLMTGTPAPKSPLDWWNQCEIACPGYLKEGDISKFRKRLCVIEQRESMAGGVYPHIVTWRDNTNKCDICGEAKDSERHINANRLLVSAVANMRNLSSAVDNADAESPMKHVFVPSKNEVAFLYERISGLALIKLKKDCLDLPDKIYEQIIIKTTPDILRAAQLITKRSARAIETLTLLRELSDGFQYQMTVSGEETCPNCKGTGRTCEPVFKDIEEQGDGSGEQQDARERSLASAPIVDVEATIEIECPLCAGKGKIPTYTRTATRVPCPKDDVIINELGEHEEVGRLIIWGGFTETIDKLVEICHKEGWATLRVDGRGYFGETEAGEPVDANVLLDAMDRSNPKYDDLLEVYPQVCFVGHPQAGGMALTLTASPTSIYYSNSFDGQARMQSEDRFHRMGMDKTRGAIIKDLIHLRTDALVLDNLKQKKTLQSITLGEIQNAIFNAIQ